jgi:hypothetical protein
MENNIKKDILAGKSTDFIIAKYISRKTDSDDILSIIRMIKWTHWKKTGERI